MRPRHQNQIEMGFPAVNRGDAEFPVESREGAFMSKLSFGPYPVEITHEDKEFFPDDHITKGDLIGYYIEIVSVMLPYLQDRLIVMQRFPDGITGQQFYQKEVPDYFPDWIERHTVKKEGGSVTHLVARNAASLAYLANQGCITPHTWLSRIDNIDCPDQLVFDLDPSSEGTSRRTFQTVRQAARNLQTLLEDLGLYPVVKTSGSRGLHVLVPLDRTASFDEARRFAQRVASVMVQKDPGHLTVEQRKANRGNRIYIDTGRNAYAQTVVPPYAVRALPHAPVSTPLEWQELDDSNLHSQTFHIGNIRERLSLTKDPWAGMMRHARSLVEPGRRLGATREAGTA